MRRLLIALAAASTVGSTLAHAQVSVTEPWIRATVPGQKVAGGYMQLKSERNVALVDASSPAAARVEIHEMAMEGNVMKMRAMTKLDLPAGRTVELKPGGYHIMFMEIKEPMKPGAQVPVTLVFEDGEKKRSSINVTAEVRPLSGAPGAKKDEHKHH
jgi:hypothetical protein